MIKNYRTFDANKIYGGISAPTQMFPEAPTQPQNKPLPETPKPATTKTNNWSTSLQTVLDQPPSTLPLQLLFGGIVFCTAFSAWAILGHIDEVGHAYGRLIPKGEPYKINPIGSGKVARIAVKEGQSVKAGQVLFELDSQIAANEVERLLQERSGSQTQLIQTQGLIEQTRQEAKTLAESIKAGAKAAEIAVTQAQVKAKGNEAAISEAKEKIATIKTLLTQVQGDAKAHEDRLARLQPLVEQGAIAKEYMFQGEQSLRERQRTITQTQGEIQQTLAQIQRLEVERNQALAEPNRLQAQGNQLAAQGQKSLIEAQQKIQQLEVQNSQIQAKIAENEKLLTRAKAELKQLSLSAPVDGVVLSLNVSNIGEVLKPGQTVAEIAPDNAPLVLSSVLPNREAGFVKTNMSAQIKFDAFPYQEYGLVSGKVTSISPDSKPDEKLGTVYRLEISLDRNAKSANERTIQLKAGQTASADIIIRRRRIIDIILDPIRQLKKGGISL
jgi:hemolysin D